MEELNRSVSLRSYGQKDPLNEYKSEAYRYFEELMANLRNEICGAMFRTATNLQAFQRMLSTLQGQARATGPTDPSESNAFATAVGAGQPTPPVDREQAASAVASATERARAPRPAPPARKRAAPVEPVRRDLPKIGRNDVVRIRKDGEVREMKYKKAEALIRNEGWELVETAETSS
jgi:preprotein translocase subunit SecA